MTVKRRLKNRKGFSLAEMLLAVLILLLVSVIVATGVPAARNAYYKVILASNAQSLLSTTATALRDELGTAWNVQLTESGDSVTYFNADTGGMAMLALNGDGGFTITEYVEAEALDLNNKASERSHSLVPAAAATDGMVITCGGMAIVENTVIFSNLVVTKDGVELASLDTLAVRLIASSAATISEPATPADGT